MNSLADWALARLRQAMPDELIFDGARSATTFDDRPASADEPRCVVVYCALPKHDVVTLAVGKDQAQARITVHSFGTARNEVEWRQGRIQRALKNQIPAVDMYEFGYVEHSVSREGDKDTTVPGRPVRSAIDQFMVTGFEK